nr:hypothetical protein [Novosphingobium sp.]
AVHAAQVVRRQREVLASEVRRRYAAELASAAKSPLSCLRGFQVSRDKEVNNQRNLLIQNHRVAKSVHEILPLKYFGFSITSK